MTLTQGQTAPDFTLPRDGGGEITLSEQQGAVVLYFYPKDSTPGCTTEALDFTALGAEFAAANAVVIGVSRDPVKALDRFKTKQSLGVILASDEEGAVTEAYGVWGEKKLYGKVSMGTVRSTFLIDADGVIRGAWRKVKVDGHVEAVLAAVKAL